MTPMLAAICEEFCASQLHSFAFSQPIAGGGVCQGGEGVSMVGDWGDAPAFEQGVRWLILPVQSPTPFCVSWGELYAKCRYGRSFSGVVPSGLRVIRSQSSLT
jgi:hypothetical protein